MTEEYRNQVRLLLSVLPIVARQKDLALKGGTALNFFWHLSKSIFFRTEKSLGTKLIQKKMYQLSSLFNNWECNLNSV